VHPQPAVGDGAIKTCFVFRLRALELKQERSVDQLDEDAAVSTALAICTSLRAAASGSLRLLRSTNFMGFGSFCGARLEHEAEAERNRRAFNRLAVITRRERQRNGPSAAATLRPSGLYCAGRKPSTMGTLTWFRFHYTSPVE
jgi:hypothetical protein